MQRVFISIDSVYIANTGEFGAYQVTTALSLVAVHADNTMMQATVTLATPFDPLTITTASAFEAIRAATFTYLTDGYGLDLTGYDVRFCGDKLFFVHPT